jgi:hypothetical protein
MALALEFGLTQLNRTLMIISQMYAVTIRDMIWLGP